MATKKTTQIADFMIEDEGAAEAPAPAPAPEPTIVAPTTKNVKIKGTWTMFWGTQRWDFIDGHRYDLPLDLFAYLRKSGNIYDTL
jgi:hypothetical protein